MIYLLKENEYYRTIRGREKTEKYKTKYTFLTDQVSGQKRQREESSNESDEESNAKRRKMEKFVTDIRNEYEPKKSKTIHPQLQTWSLPLLSRNRRS